MNEMKKDIKSLFCYNNYPNLKTVILVLVNTLSLEQIANLGKSFEKIGFKAYTFKDGRDDQYMLVKNISDDMFRFVIRQEDYDIDSYIFCLTNNCNHRYPKLTLNKKYKGPLALTPKARWMEMETIKAKRLSIINTFFSNVKCITDMNITPIEFFSSLLEMGRQPEIDIIKDWVICR